jgi:hypothetical protein
MKTPIRLALAVALAGAANGAHAAPNPAPPCTDASAACLERIGRLYIDALISHDGSKIPLAADVRRTEDGPTNARGPDEVRQSFASTKMVRAARDVRAYADPAKGDVVFFLLLDVDLNTADVATDAHGAGVTTAGKTQYRTANTVPAGVYTVHEAERFHISHGLIHQIEIIADVEKGAQKGSGWPTDRGDSVVK